MHEEFKLLADFNGTVLAGQETKHSVQLVTQGCDYNKTGTYKSTEESKAAFPQFLNAIL